MSDNNEAYKEVGLHVLISEQLKDDIKIQAVKSSLSVKELTTAAIEEWMMRHSSIDRWGEKRQEVLG